MFHRRRAASSSHVINTSPSPAAALAASQAFLKSRNSNVSLSSAAAAAALRTHATPPTPVANIQTKRMVRRGSSSSVGSSGDGAITGLRRASSSSSMSERTFRTGSPRGSPVVQLESNIPPVPSIPNNIAAPRLQRRASSVDPQTRVISPEPRGGAGSGRGMSVDRGTRAMAGPPSQGPNLARVPESDLAENQSVNFSYPRSPTSSPTPQRRSWHTSPVVSNNAPRAELPKLSSLVKSQPPIVEESSLIHSIHAASEKHVPKKQIATGMEGSRFAAGSMAARPKGTAVGAHTSPQTMGVVPGDSKKTTSIPRETEIERSQPVKSKSLTHTDHITSTGKDAMQEHIVDSPPPYQVEKRRSGLTESKYAQSSLQETAPAPVATYKPSRPLSPPILISQHSGTAYQDQGPGSSVVKSKNDRPQSRSPARSAHFADVAVELPNGIKHHPPPRSISPAKSALKRSPSSSIRTASPVAHPALPPAKEDVVKSEDPTKSGSKKKKNIRVSFDEETVPSTSYDDSRSSSIGSESPVSTTTRGLGASRWSTGGIASAPEPEQIMTPRPALPSFGSIRGRKKQDDESDLAEKVTETLPSTSSNVHSETLGSSSDHALASILSRDLSSKKPEHTQSDRYVNAHDPLPPEVTSVEGTGYGSDSDQSITSDIVVLSKPHHTVLEPLPESPQREVSAAPFDIPSPAQQDSENADESAVPFIKILPATPGLDEGRSPEFTMPGTFATSTDKLDDSQNKQTQPITEAKAEEFTTKASPPVSPGTILNSIISYDDDSSSDDGSSIYSDAAEDLSEYNENGFASIDAVVESPVEVHKSSVATTAPTSVELSSPENTPPKQVVKDWDQTKAYWSGLTDQKKEQLEHEALSTSVTSNGTVRSSSPLARQDAEPRKPKAAPAPSAIQQKPVQPSSSYSERPTTATSMRYTMREREPQALGTRMKKTMRSSLEMEKPHHSYGLEASAYSGVSSDTRESRATLQKKHTPPSAPTPTRVVQASLGATHHTRPKSVGSSLPPAKSAGTTLPPLRRTKSNDSDSASSFKRMRRPSTATAGGRISMRRTMRGTSTPVSIPPLRANSPDTSMVGNKPSRFSMRSLSPNSSLAGRTLRQPLPPVNESGARTLRTQSSQKKSKLSGFGKSIKPKGLSSSPSRFRSRFEDSSDDEDYVQPAFTSRFNDSDDEDDYVLPPGLTPVRGIPRRPGEDDCDSTDLSDENSDADEIAPLPSFKDIEKVSTPKKQATNGHTHTASPVISSPVSQSKYAHQIDGDTPTKQKKKRGFFGVGKKKPVQLDPFTTDITSPPTSPPRSPKLQRRSLQPQRAASDSWPLQDRIAPGDAPSHATQGRPMTSSSHADQQSRPKLGRRVSSLTTSVATAPDLTIDPKTGKPVILDRKGRKKKFQTLRRAFGLFD